VKHLPLNWDEPEGCWNHRIRKRIISGEPWYDVVEAHYESHKNAENNEECCYTEDGIAPGGSDIEELKWELEHMLAALNKPIIEEK